ncbi:ThiF family adenylyltransferase [Brachybacterium vulturis]|uniref:ThiF family adenylyltransferase n=1 Tax=Brachybacterium vulturis TaxID=2017484 RepID=UPI001FE39840|nr:ThiF family adenylyltransferase [Brachybacterium vulturis]
MSDSGVPGSGATGPDAWAASGQRPDIRARAVEPAPAPVPQERYLRQLRLPELGALGQRRLAASRVAVIGAGGLGAPVLTYLVAAGIGEITLLDPDTVDPTNLHRQVLFTGEDLGRSKAVAAAEHLHALNPEVTVRAVVDVVTPENALEQLAGHHLVLDGTDNFPTRYLASDACELLDIPLVWGSILGFAGQVSVFWGAGGRGVTYRDVHPVPPRPGEVPSCSEAGVLGMLCGVIGSSMAMEAVKVLAGLGDVLFGRLALYDALRARWDELPLARDPGRRPVERIEDVMATCGLPGPTGPTLDEVTVAELPALLAEGVRVIDIREEHELDSGMVRGAEHLPMGAVLALAGAAGGGGPRAEGPAGTGAAEPGDDAAPAGPRHRLEGAVLYCAAGSRSGSVQRSLAAQGISVRSLRGGFGAVDGTELAVAPPR